MYNWKILTQYDARKSILDAVLENRGLRTENEKELFLNIPKLNYWVRSLPKDLLKNLKKARELINSAIKDNTPIIIHGDYDSDGICATAVLFKTIKQELGYDNVFCFIPNRFEHGYGLSIRSISSSLKLLKKEATPSQVLFITVDSGITSYGEVEYLKENGHAVIITDHHQKPANLPEADCIVWNDQVVGTTISWLLSRSLGSRDDRLIALCAVATVTDLQPLLNFNRTIVKEGLDVLNKNPPLGLKKLFEVSGRKGQEVTTYDLGWVVGPRLNASGRVEDARNSLELMITTDEERVLHLAEDLNRVNSARQEKTLEMYDLVSVEENNIPKIIVSHHENYHEGMIGLVASRLVQKYYRPSVVISTNGELSKGSVRSIPGINIIEILRELEDIFENLGGHPMAAGFSIKTENIQKMKELLTDLMEKKVTEDFLLRTLEIDIEIPLSLISMELMNDINKMKPFGLGNETPVFASRNVGIAGMSYVGKGSQHLSLKLFDDVSFYRAIYFNAVDFTEGLKAGDRVDLAYNLKENFYNGSVSLDLIVKDIK